MSSAATHHPRRAGFLGLTAFLTLSSAALLHEPDSGAAQAPCDREALLAAAATLTPRDVRVPAHSERSSRCVLVSDGGVVLGTPLPVSLPGAPCALAVAFRHTILRSETCGYDIHLDPLELTGVALVRRAGPRFRTITAAHFPMQGLEALHVTEGGARMWLHGEELRFRRGRLRLLRELPPGRR